jgi:hypothetical protein
MYTLSKEEEKFINSLGKADGVFAYLTLCKKIIEKEETGEVYTLHFKYFIYVICKKYKDFNFSSLKIKDIIKYIKLNFNANFYKTQFFNLFENHHDYIDFWEKLNWGTKEELGEDFFASYNNAILSNKEIKEIYLSRCPAYIEEYILT